LKWVTRLVLRASLFGSALTLLLLNTTSLSASALPAETAVVTEFTNYLTRLKNHITWNTLPVRVYFTRDAAYTPAREKAARAGFDTWVQATRGFVGYEVQDGPEEAQITVTFNPGNNDGHTATRFSNLLIDGARISVGVQRGWGRDIACIAAHEFGHALGIDGHSGDLRDVMYPVHRMGHLWSITRRDLTTLALAYRVDAQIAMKWIPINR